MVKNWTRSDQALHAALNLEIRFRKFSFTTVKATCPLFKQRGLSIQQKVKNIGSLISSQLDLKVLADMTDLESAIIATSECQQDTNFAELPPSADTGVQEQSTEDTDTQGPATTEAEAKDTTSLSLDLPVPGEFILGAFEDRAYPGEVSSVIGDKITIDFLQAVRVNAKESLWK